MPAQTSPPATPPGRRHGSEASADRGEVAHQELVDIIELLTALVRLEVAAEVGEALDELLGNFATAGDLLDARPDPLGDRRLRAIDDDEVIVMSWLRLCPGSTTPGS